MPEPALTVWEFIGGPADGSRSAFPDDGKPPPAEVGFAHQYGDPKHRYVFVDESLRPSGKCRRYRHAGPEVPATSPEGT